MKLVTYRREGATRLGGVVDDGVVDLQRAYRFILEQKGEEKRAALEMPGEMRSLLNGGRIFLARAKETLSMFQPLVKREKDAGKWQSDGIYFPWSAVSLAPPIPNPGKIICLGKNYKAHAEETGGDIPTIPIIFTRFSSTLLGPNDPIPIPRASDKIDYEGELAVVIGKRGRYIREEEAMDFVAGYMILNDVSARDYQQKTSQWTLGKNFDASAPTGPALVMKEEVKDPHNLEIRTIVSGEVLQDSNTSLMIFKIPYLISYLSEVFALEPGDIISTGTPDGVGFVRKPPRFLKPGDQVRVEVSGLGFIENPVIAESR